MYLYFLFFLISNVFADCSNCEQFKNQLNELNNKNIRLKQILDLNQSEITKTSDVGIIIKIKSNLLLTQIRIETTKNEIEAITEGCKTCL